MTRNGLQLGTLTAALLALAALGGCPTGLDPGGGEPLDGVPGDTGGGGGTDGGGGGGGGSGAEPENQPPIASLSFAPPSGIRPGVTVTLDASGSTDSDGDPIAFEWAQTAGPAVTLSSSVDAQTTFAAPDVVENSALQFSVTVRDGRGGSASASATLTVEVAAEFAGSPQSVSTYRDSLTSDEAYHLLRRAGFGATPEEVQAAVARGLGATVDDLLTAKANPDWLLALADQYQDNLPKRWLLYMIDGPNPLLERMTLFWHDRFATSRRVLEYGDRNLAVLHWRMLRTYALGNYREFLEALTLDPLMLIWLDNGNSPKDNPNENYTREFWELFTLGRDTLYTEQDIREGARAFTGITLLRQSGRDARPIFDLLNHDETPKLIFPTRTAGALNYSYDTVIDLTLAQPEATRYVARNLFACFVHDHPSDAVLDELATEFRAGNFEIAPLVRRILTSQALFSPEARGNQISSPVEQFVGWARTLDMHVHSADSQGFQLDRVVFDLYGSGQELLNPPGVEGWHENEAWLKDQWTLNRVRTLSRTMEFGPDRVSTLPYHLLPPRDTWNQRDVRGQIVDAIARVFHLPLTTEERDIYVEVLDQGGWLAFHLGDSRYQPQHVFEMVRLMAMDERVIGR
ncbi:MAG: DUF1800 family protein [Phycisphaerae bacterium]